MKRLAIDPGDVHVGFALDSSGCVVAGEWTPGECCDQVTYLMTQDVVDELVIEEFILYDKDIDKQAWSKLQTSQLIGALKWIAHMFRIPVVEQSATIKKPTRRQLAARGIKQVGPSIHARDAELHYWYRTLRRAKEEADELGAVDTGSDTDRRGGGRGRAVDQGR